MGEVRVRVKLTNVADESLVRRGQLAPDQVRTYEADAVVDTGAVRCVLPPFIADRLGLQRIRRTVAGSPTVGSPRLISPSQSTWMSTAG